MSKTNVVYPVTSCLYPSIQSTNYFVWGDGCSLFRYSIAVHFVCYCHFYSFRPAFHWRSLWFCCWSCPPLSYWRWSFIGLSLHMYVCFSIVLSLLECWASLLHLLYALHFHTRLCPSWLL